MSGNFTKPLYDKCAYEKKVRESVDPANYRLDPNYSTNCNQCWSPYGMPYDGIVGTSLVDIDSMLRGMCPSVTPSFKSDISASSCPKNFDTEYSRISDPNYATRGCVVDQPRLDFPLFDPQCQIFENFHVNTRLQAKDNHVAVWQQPLDQTNTLPPKPTRKPISCKVKVNCE